MYAIVDIAGQQLKVEKDQKIFVNRLEGKEGSKVDFDQILLIDDNGKVKVGAPVVKDMVVSASIVSHLKGDKVKVFKKKRRKGYKVLNGHRQLLTELHIENISSGMVKTAEKKVEAKPKTEAKPKAAPKTANKPAEEKASKPKAATTAKPVAVKKETKTVKKEVKSAAKPKSAATKKPASK